MRPNKFDGDIAEEAREAYAYIFAVWEMLTNNIPGLPSTRTTFLSENFFWTGKITCNPKSSLHIGRRMRIGHLVLDADGEYAMHIFPFAEFHGISHDRARAVWIAKNLSIIKKAEGPKTYSILIPASEAILKKCIADARTVQHLQEAGQNLGRSENITLDSGANMLVWLPPEARVEYYLAGTDGLFQKEGSYHRMLETLVATKAQQPTTVK